MDLRYHLISIVAVFLALAVGMMVGSSFLAGSVERRLIVDLKDEFGKLRQENNQKQRMIDDLKESCERERRFERAVAPLIVSNQLSWWRVAIIQTGDYTEATQSARSILEEAGAQIISVTTISNLDTPSARKRAARAVELIAGEDNPLDPVGSALEIVAGVIATGSRAEALSVMEDKGLLSKVGEYNRRALNIVVVGGSRRKGDGRAHRIDLVLIDKLKALGANIIGCEPADAVTSYIPTYHQKAVTTVDNVDEPSGQVALVFAVAGDTGNFGVKKSANRVLPTYLESGKWRSEFRR